MGMAEDRLLYQVTKRQKAHSREEKRRWKQAIVLHQRLLHYREQ